MAKQFGATWWGQAYLGALSRIDYENRLTRGKTYARGNRISNVRIDHHIVEALVQGSRPKPYQVQIVHIPLLPADQKKITNALAARPDLVSDILNARLPLELTDICKALQIKLFPESWRDIKLNCNCPDWAVPCKHLAAVLYTLANEIDKDPFLVFNLLNFDLVAALQKKGYDLITSDHGEPLLAIDSLLSEKDLPRGTPPFQSDIYYQMDISSIPKIGTDIPLFLEPRPVFCHDADFRAILEQSYRRIASFSGKEGNHSDQELPPALALRHLRHIDYIEILLHQDLTVDAIWLEGMDDAHTIQSANLSEIVEMLQRLPTAELYTLADDFKLLALALDIAVGFTQSGTVLPAIYKMKSQDLVIRWEPCMNIEIVRQIVGQYQKILRYDFISVKDEEGHIRYLKKDTQAFSLISLFISHLVTSAMRLHLPASADRAYELFFSGKPQKLQTFTEQKTGQSIRQWLDILTYTGQKFKPLIRIDEIKANAFELHLDLEAHHQVPTSVISLARFMDDPRYQEDHIPVLKILSLLSDRLPDLRKFVRSGGNEKVRLDEKAVIGLLEHVNGLMQLTQSTVLLPKSLQNLIRPKAGIRISTRELKNSSGLLALHQILAFEWRIALGDQTVSVDEFKKMLESSGQLIRLTDQYLLIEQKEIQSILSHLARAKAPGSLDLLRYAVSEDFEGSKVALTKDAKKLIDSIRQQKSIPLPRHIKAELRPYQKRGYEWLYKNASLGFGSILADDMGLGKTLQVLTFLQKAKEEKWLEEGPALIIAPATLLTNWVRECQRFTPKLNPMIYHGNGRALPDQNTDLLITTYGLARTDQKKLTSVSWSVVIIDEAQYIKNTTASQTRAVIDIPSKIRIAMSGTPVENRMMEYFSISQFANPGYLGTATSFKQNIANPIERHRDQQRLDLFKRMTTPFLLRRLKTDKTIIKDLPDKIILNRYISLTPEQISLYEASTKEAMHLIATAKDAITRKGLVLRMLLQLKQICNHPRNFLKRGKYDAARTGKAEALLEILQQVREEGRKALIFTQYREMGDILIEMMKEMGEDVLFLHGGLSRKERDEIVRSFQDDHWPQVLILSIKAAGTGLNLTAATHVIHYDLWWNPAVEAQATDRAFRIGQKHNVTVHRIIAKNTLEENIDRLMDQERDLANLTVTTGEKWIGDLTNGEIENLVGLKK